MCNYFVIQNLNFSGEMGAEEHNSKMESQLSRKNAKNSYEKNLTNPADMQQH